MVDGVKEKGYTKLPLLEEAVAAHLCPPAALGWKTKTAHLTKLCRATSALATLTRSPSGLFGFAVAHFAERFTTAQNTSQAMRHYLPASLSQVLDASSRPKLSTTQHYAKPASTPTQPQQKVEPEMKQRFHPGKRYPFPKHKGPCPKLVLDPDPPKQP